MSWFSFHGGHSGEFCAHAKGTLDAVVRTAVERGFTHYGLSEHAPRFRDVDLYPGEEALGTEGLASAFRAYVAEALRLRELHAGSIELLIGFETEMLPPERWADAMDALRRAHPFDYVVGSVHDIDGRWVDYSAAATEGLKADLGGAEALHLAWFARMTTMVETLQPDVVGHIDLVRKFEPAGFRFGPRALAAAERLLEAVAATGGALDVNCAPARNGYGPPYPLPDLLAMARRMGVGVTLGDDSHGPETVGIGLELSLAAIAAAGYRTIRRLDRRNGWRDVPIETVSPR
ncbi:histidinol-phosphatase [Aureimonas endophytica]|uniref:Histidinol-phosphatase n=1 Tax=Aureimonas endophytica TaxID=2027858 RepID=A0A916ZP51_9HYPH|nr:histidinol-phosphatase [Aureimonas endophytica]GGE05811.1 histidinol-phosphatase [Aureimonas endophytica]